MEFTLGADPRLIRKLKVFSKKRNAVSYDSAGSVSEQELKESMEVALELQNSVLAWLKHQHPEFSGS